MGEPNLIPGGDLRTFFDDAVREAVGNAIGLDESEVIRYLSGMLADFALADNLYRIQSVEGRRLEDVANMLVEGDVGLRATSFNREREVHRHIGDFTLFWTGFFPESLPRIKASGPDQLIDYVRQGKQSYQIVSLFDMGRYRDEAPLFRRLSNEFERCMEGLRLVRNQLGVFGGAS